MRRLLISAAHKSSGKTTVSIGLLRALRARGLIVQPYKKGPDYIDPMWLAQASGRTCRNLDLHLMPRDEIVRMFVREAAGADLCLVEGNKGLYDGLALDGRDSNAALAALLGLPVVLVLDARGMTRGIAPLILGYQSFEADIVIAGVILNHVGGARHEAKLRAVIEHYTDVPVVGAIQHDDDLVIVERHLGLVPSNEAGDADAKIDCLGESIGAEVDLDRLLAIASDAPAIDGAVLAVPAQRRSDGQDGGLPLPAERGERRGEGRPGAARVRIGIARDRAFGFYYPDDLEALAAAGADVVPFDTLHDRTLPAVDGLFIGGGFPESFLDALEANAPLRAQIRAAIEEGLPVYAECGGLMYLARTLAWRGRCAAMVGALPFDVVMHDRPVGRGYVEVAETPACPWPRLPHSPTTVRAHEFHYSSVEHLVEAVDFAYDVRRGHGIDGRHDGIVHRNVVASYAHRRNVGGDDWPARFVAFVHEAKQQRRAHLHRRLRLAAAGGRGVSPRGRRPDDLDARAGPVSA